MKKMIRIRNSIIIILSITVVVLSIGFVILELKYTEQKNKKYTFNTVFTKITKTNSIKGSKSEPASLADISEDGSRIKLQFRLAAVHDEITYTATIKNKGTLPCKIIDVIESPDYNKENLKKIISPVTITISDIEDKIIQPNEEIQLKIIVYYNPTKEKDEKEEIRKFDYDISFFAKSI